MTEAAAVRDLAHGRRVTYSPKVFIPLTKLCRDRCGYCTFAESPRTVESPPVRNSSAEGTPSREFAITAPASARTLTL